MSAQSLPEFKGYGLDYAFLKAFRKATEDADTYSRWVREWILDCPSHDAYLNKLGEWQVQDVKLREKRRMTN